MPFASIQATKHNPADFLVRHSVSTESGVGPEHHRYPMWEPRKALPGLPIGQGERLAA